MGWATRNINDLSHVVKLRPRCVACGKQFHRQTTFTATVGPGETRSEVRARLVEQGRQYEPMPVCTSCGVDQKVTFLGPGQWEQPFLHHTVWVCEAPCPLHAPSGHHMQTWPLEWRADRQILERVCPHRVGHPDPDDRQVRNEEYQRIHGCDGCCSDDDTGGMGLAFG